jgi:hypothetical protein
MGNDLPERVSPVIRALWELENALRRALQNAAFLRKEAALQHLEEARRHLQEALMAVRGESVPAAMSGGGTPIDNKPHDSPHPDDPVNTPTRVPRG